MSKTPEDTYLSQDDLRAFLMRRTAVEQASLTFQMIQSGYRLWADEIRQKYSLVGNFDVSPDTGQVVLREDDEGGG